MALTLPKSARLLRPREFRAVRGFRYATTNLLFIYQKGGRGRLGVSIPKKILRRAVARNRVRRLIREVFRKRRALLHEIDLHIIAIPGLGEVWSSWTEADVRREFDTWMKKARME